MRPRDTLQVGLCKTCQQPHASPEPHVDVCGGDETVSVAVPEGDVLLAGGAKAGRGLGQWMRGEA